VLRVAVGEALRVVDLLAATRIVVHMEADDAVHDHLDSGVEVHEERIVTTFSSTAAEVQALVQLVDSKPQTNHGRVRRAVPELWGSDVSEGRLLHAQHLVSLKT
jgi:hypothetical protein